jgi:hypothetical protein
MLKWILAVICIVIALDLFVGDPIHLRPLCYDAFLATRSFAQGIFHSVHR